MDWILLGTETDRGEEGVRGNEREREVFVSYLVLYLFVHSFGSRPLSMVAFSAGSP